jgi:hypothetical protein
MLICWVAWDILTVHRAEMLFQFPSALKAK